MKLPKIMILIFSLAYYGCNDTDLNIKHNSCECGFFQDSVNELITENWYHGGWISCPIHYFDTNRNHNNHVGVVSSAYFSSNLYRLYEYPAKCYKKNKPFYRLTFIDSFFGSFMIKIEGTESNKVLLTEKKQAYLESSTEYSYSKSSKIIDTLPISVVSKIFSKNSFCEMMTQENFNLGSDGMIVLIECFEKGEYHVVERWQPNINHATRDTAELQSFIKISNFFIELVQNQLIINDSLSSLLKLRKF